MLKKIKNIAKEKNVSALVSNVCIAFLGLLSFMLLTRQLPKELFGDWVLFVTLATFFDLLRFGLTRTAVVRLLAGAKREEYNRLLASSYRINLALLLPIISISYFLLLVLNVFDIALSGGYLLFITWYPILALCNLGWNNASALFQAEQHFTRMMFVRLSNVGLFVLFLVINLFYLKKGVSEIIWVYLAVNFISSVWCSLKGWDGLCSLKFADRATEKELVRFGKFSMGTLVGSSLLKSADTLIIGLSPILGSAGIAMYAIPLKLTDLLGIPLRSFTMTAYPRMSKLCKEQNFNALRKAFYGYSGAITLLFIPVALFCFVFAEELILFLGGTAYKDSMDVLTVVFRIFTIYTVLLPIDRFTGVLLDSINKPHLNLYKVLFMTTANIIIDLIAVFVFNSLVLVALGTVIFTVLGIFLGFYFLRKELQIQVKQILPEGIYFFRNLNTFLK